MLYEVITPNSKMTILPNTSEFLSGIFSCFNLEMLRFTLIYSVCNPYSYSIAGSNKNDIMKTAAKMIVLGFLSLCVSCERHVDSDLAKAHEDTIV